MNLYELSVQGLQIQDCLIESQGELTPELETRLDALLAEGAQSIEAAAMVVRSLEANASLCREEAKRFTERARSFESQAESLKARMVFAVDVLGGKVKTPKFTIWAQSSAPTIQFEYKEGRTIDDVYAMWPEAVRVKMELDKIKLAELAKRGETPEVLTAREVEGARYLRIK